MSDSATPLVSVVIPCYNGQRFLAEAIDSVLSQTYRNVELIVVDDGSTDHSAAIMAGYGSRINVVRQANAGLPAARNAGIRPSRGALLAFLDADDYWRSDFVAKMVTAMTRSGTAIAYCGWQNIGLQGPRGQPFVPPDYEQAPNKNERVIGGVLWPVHAALVRRSVAETIGGFDSKWSTCEDFAFWIRAATSCQLVLVPEVLAFYRHHEGPQMTKARATVAITHWQVQRDFLTQHPEFTISLGKPTIRRISDGRLLQRGYAFFWDRDLESAQTIFRLVARTGYGSLRDWMYLLPALMPPRLYRAFVRCLDRRNAGVTHP